MLVRSFDQIVSLISATSGDSIEASLSAARSRAIRSLCAIIAFADLEPVPVGERFSTTPGAITSFDEKITPPMMRCLGTAARSLPPGSRKPRSGVGGCSCGKSDIVPPGNAVLGKDHGGVVAQQRFQSGGKRRDPGRLQRRDHDILRTQRRRIVGSLNLAFELGVADPQGQAVFLHRVEMRPAHHAGDVMTGQRQSHREMAADGAAPKTHIRIELKFLPRG